MTRNRYTANYVGRCAYCWAPIVPGDAVRFDRNAKPAHDECMDGMHGYRAPEPDAPTVSCPECFETVCECLTDTWHKPVVNS